MNKKQFRCPLCLEDYVIHHEENGTHLYICEYCPFIAMEYYTPQDIGNLKKYTERI